MRNLQITLFIIAFMALSTQSFRHIYIKFIEPKKSILDEFKTNVENNIDSSKTLIELKELYSLAKAKYDSIDRQNDSSYTGKELLSKSEEDKRRIENTINYRENQNKEIFEIYFFWFMGFLALTIGCLVYWKFNRWIGISSIITGFCEMIWWTKPTFRSFSGISEFELLLNLKIIFSLASLFLLTALWIIFNNYWKIKNKEV